MKLFTSKYLMSLLIVGGIIFVFQSYTKVSTLQYTSAFADTKGGYGGKIIKVTNLNANGPGSFYEAVRSKGKRIIVFEIAGVIDMKQKLITIRDPYLTIAGQTAPSPGITIINGGILVSSHDVIIQHIRVRPGNNLIKKIWSIDGLSTKGAVNVIIDHCSFSWASDENLSASGPRFEGKTPNDWRRNTSRRITFSNNVISEGLRYSTHKFGEHSKGTLIHDNVTGVLIKGNLYAHNMDRNPYLKGGTSGIIINNFIYNPGKAAIRYMLAEKEWLMKEKQIGRWTILGNVMQLGPDSENISLLDVRNGPCELFLQDNLAFNLDGSKAHIYSGDKNKIVTSRSIWIEDLDVVSSKSVKSQILENAGARPWDRDVVDKRILEDIKTLKGRIIDNEGEVGGYPKVKEVRKAFNSKEWDFKYLHK